MPIFFWGDLPIIKYWHSFALIIILSVYLIFRKKFSKKLTILMSLWVVLTFAFFSLYSKVLSEYYLNSVNIIWFTIFIVSIASFFEEKNKIKIIGFLLLSIFLTINTYRFISRPINKSAYIEKLNLVDYIESDSKAHNYPCISISYITDPGYNLGYRYFFYQENNMHVNQPKSKSPVYTIVFPLSKVDRFDKSFGALGVINPDYKKYNKEDVDKSCQGANSNLTDPMFGFPQ